jgi:hypothetical protein
MLILLTSNLPSCLFIWFRLLMLPELIIFEYKWILFIRISIRILFLQYSNIFANYEYFFKETRIRSISRLLNIRKSIRILSWSIRFNSGCFKQHFPQVKKNFIIFSTYTQNLTLKLLSFVKTIEHSVNVKSFSTRWLHSIFIILSMFEVVFCFWFSFYN